MARSKSTGITGFFTNLFMKAIVILIVVIGLMYVIGIGLHILAPHCVLRAYHVSPFDVLIVIILVWLLFKFNKKF